MDEWEHELLTLPEDAATPSARRTETGWATRLVRYYWEGDEFTPRGMLEPTRGRYTPWTNKIEHLKSFILPTG